VWWIQARTPSVPVLIVDIKFDGTRTGHEVMTVMTWKAPLVVVVAPSSSFPLLRTHHRHCQSASLLKNYYSFIKK
jgi:hypothetical protein